MPQQNARSITAAASCPLQPAPGQRATARRPAQPQRQPRHTCICMQESPELTKKLAPHHKPQTHNGDGTELYAIAG